MTSIADRTNSRPAWFVGAAFGGTDDQTDRFVRDGIWEGGPAETYGDLINSIREGDRIAIKSWYTRKNGLPFDNQGKFVSVMAIKAIGVVTANLGDRRNLKVAWKPVEPLREWYFYTNSKTVWRVLPVAGQWNEWYASSLISFAFDSKEQDIIGFLDAGWGQKYGYSVDPAEGEDRPDPVLDYSIDDIMDDGCFLEHDQLELMQQRLESKQNLILQGPPGTGKTWLARKLAYALVGRKDDRNVQPMQFHPNLSYEDFVRGWRPQGNGQLTLVDGPFLQLVERARHDRDNDYVMVIEEINRGNPASIFGEMLTLLEADKRTPTEALALAYSREDGERMHIPPNVYVIGTMNLADRSLAMVDLALRRRFAFFDLEPMLNDTWREWVNKQCSIDEGFLAGVAQRINALNEDIAADRNLGRQFRIGQSFVTPAPGTDIGDPEAWFTQVVNTEIVPLLHEYWFDNPDRVAEARSKLLGIT